MRWRYFAFWAVALFFLSIVCCPTFANLESAAMYCGEPDGKIEDPHNQMLMEKIAKRLEEKRSELIALYRDLHSHPEVSGREERTARIISEHLRDLGLKVEAGVGGHGVVGILKGGKPGPVVAYRADMDAVFSNDPDPVSFKSETPGVRHICGHDLHVTVALGIAEALVSIRENLPGTVKFIFQPSEENAEGAKAMIADGVLEKPAPEAILAVHCAPLEVGQIGSVEGMLLPGLDVIQVTIDGEGDLKKSAGAIAGVIAGVSTVSFADIQKLEFGSSSGQESVQNDFIFAVVVSSEKTSGKNQWTLKAMARTSSEENSAIAKKNIQAGIEKLDLPGISTKIDYSNGVVPAVMNDPELVRSAMGSIRSAHGDESLIVVEQVPPFFGEDFAFYLQKIPGVMYWLGVSNEKKGILGLPHHPRFAVDEEAIFVGSKTMAAVLLNYLDTIK
ncbi:MAG: amidohydrolase [Candidatus Aminicenantes bacterium]|nr:MAG: amidohydrolase [Candidatus Aminicenantes bacterium]